ncbi:HAD family hydrolase [Salirhabdus salicampi]|uniref:HAD family hydrolase n=1 Tax=Salirhabdus salicampi TaxID=476102 RepID=UPI0020C4F8E7|nr:HAD family hydrolase [Salirhabdus salicampi]MCP8615681.1 HAD family hydrolase [Salirhabdus salicampi]
MIKAVVFDFDGLIIDTEFALYESFCNVLNVEEREMPIGEYATFIGTDSTDLLDYIVRKSNKRLTKEDIVEKTNRIHRQKLEYPVARDGVEDYLKTAKDLGLKIGLASSSNRKWVTSFLEHLGFIKYFDVIQTSDDVEMVKPDPALYRNVIKAFGIKPSEAIAFEDSANGLKAAIGAGLNCVIVPNKVTKNLEFEGYHLRLNSMKDKSLKEVITNFNIQ